MKKAFNFLFVTTKTGFFLLAALLWSAIMFFVNNHYQITWEEIFVEADGMVFDLVVFGVILTIYEAYRETKEKKEKALKEKNEKIERLHEEIADYSSWNEKEATFRIVGAIKRLNKLGVSKIQLAKSYLDNAELIDANLEGAIFFISDLKGSRLSHANLKDAIIYRTSFEGAIMINAKLEGARITESNLKGANLGSINVDALLEKQSIKRTDLEERNNTDLILPGANLKNAILKENDLEGAIVGLDWFENLATWNVIGREEIMEKYQIDENGILRVK